MEVNWRMPQLFRMIVFVAYFTCIYDGSLLLSYITPKVYITLTWSTDQMPTKRSLWEPSSFPCSRIKETINLQGSHKSIEDSHTAVSVEAEPHMCTGRMGGGFAPFFFRVSSSPYFIILALMLTKWKRLAHPLICIKFGEIRQNI